MAEPTEPARERKGVWAAIDLLTGADTEGKRDANEVPGSLAFMRARWKEGDTSEGFFRRYRRLRGEYRGELERAAGNLRTYETIAQSAAFTREFAALLFASCIIATTGLFQGSTGVIIGAMLIAPLMMPILGFALAVVWGDRRLIWRSLGTLLVGIVIVLMLSGGLVLVVPGIEINSEIQARINPNLYDILIAVASGLIGAYAYANPRISPSIAGVSIAVALMPPMCTVGIGIGLGNFDIASGALLLFLSNLLGISLAASFVFWRLRIHPMTSSASDVGIRVGRNVGLTAILLVAVALPLGFFMKQGYAIKKLDGEVRQQLERGLRDGEILSLTVTRSGSGYEVRSVVIVPPGTAEDQLQQLRSGIERIVPSETVLRLYFLRTDAAELVVSAPNSRLAGTGEASTDAAPTSATEPTPTPTTKKPAAKTRAKRTQ